jgi:hypothetical protein
VGDRTDNGQKRWYLALLIITAALPVGFCLLYLIMHGTCAFPAPGRTPTVVADDLVHSALWGGVSIKRGISFGDTIIPLLRNESNDFTWLAEYNRSQIAEVLAGIRTPLSQQTLRELYRRDDENARLIGAYGLAYQGYYPDPIDAKCFLIREIDDEYPVELAIAALGYCKQPYAVPYLCKIVTNKNGDFWDLRVACEALARIDDPHGIIPIENLLRHSESDVSAVAFQALIALGDRNAVPLAINAITYCEEYDQKRLIASLRAVTGKKFGKNIIAWKHWWHKDGATWTIPAKFRVAYDQAPWPH